MAGKNYFIIADQDRGKTFFGKQILHALRHRDSYIYDINLEHTRNKINCKVNLPDMHEFMDLIPQSTDPKSNVNAYYAEATGFFGTSGTTPKALKMQIFRRFHTGNVNLFEFHGLEMLPIDILPAADFIVLFRTSDNFDRLKKKFGGDPRGTEILNAFQKIQKSTNGTRFDRERKIYADEYSKNNFHNKIILAK